MVPSMITLAEALELAIGHHRTGRLSEAEALYRQVLGVEPRHADALHLLGRIEHTRGRFDEAVELFDRAIAADGSPPMFYNNLGEALQAQGRLDEALAAYREAA